MKMQFGVEYPRSGKQIECADEVEAREAFNCASQEDGESIALVLNGKWALVRGRTLKNLRESFPESATLYDKLTEQKLVVSRYVECIWGGGAPGYSQRIDSAQSGALLEYEAINEFARFADRYFLKVSIEAYVSEVVGEVAEKGEYMIGDPLYGAIIISAGAPQAKAESWYSFSGGD